MGIVGPSLMASLKGLPPNSHTALPLWSHPAAKAAGKCSLQADMWPESQDSVPSPGACQALAFFHFPSALIYLPFSVPTRTMAKRCGGDPAYKTQLGKLSHLEELGLLFY